MQRGTCRFRTSLIGEYTKQIKEEVRATVIGKGNYIYLEVFFPNAVMSHSVGELFPAVSH